MEHKIRHKQRRVYRRLYADVIVLGILFAISVMFIIKGNLDRIFGKTIITGSHLHLIQALAVVVLMAFVLSIFALRRWQELFGEIEKRITIEHALTESERRYRRLFEDSPISLWEVDFSAIRSRIYALKRDGISNFASYFENNQNAIKEFAILGRVLEVNKATLELYKAPDCDTLREKAQAIISDESLEVMEKEILAIASYARQFESEAKIKTIFGESLFVTFRWAVAPGHEKDYAKVFLSLVDITPQKKAEEIIRRLAFHDALTGLPNRLVFQDRLALALAQARRKQQMLAVMMLDLDRFKDVNDTRGHDVGDEVLKAAGQRLQSIVREGDTVCRMGGDEFMLLFPEVSAEVDAIHIAEKIIEEFQAPLYVRNHEIPITTSIGVSIFPLDAKEPEELIRYSDMAMYRAKDYGRNNFQRYTSTNTLQNQRQ